MNPTANPQLASTMPNSDPSDDDAARRQPHHQQTEQGASQQERRRAPGRRRERRRAPRREQGLGGGDHRRTRRRGRRRQTARQLLGQEHLAPLLQRAVDRRTEDQIERQVEPEGLGRHAQRVLAQRHPSARSAGLAQAPAQGQVDGVAHPGRAVVQEVVVLVRAVRRAGVFDAAAAAGGARRRATTSAAAPRCCGSPARTRRARRAATPPTASRSTGRPESRGSAAANRR